MIKEEIKLFLVEKYKIIGFLLVSFIVILSLYYLFEYKKNNIEITMSIGFVNYDDTEEVKYFFNIFNNTSFSEVFNIIELDEKTAEEMIQKDEISAYVIIPEGFIKSVYIGENMALTIVGNEKDWIEVSIIKLAINIGISYLTTAQSGIYSTIDVLNDEGITASKIDEIILPINIAYGTSLLSFNKYYDETLVNPTGNTTLKDYYIFSTIFFLMMISSSIFIEIIQESTKGNILNKYSFYGMGLKKVFLNKFIALFIVVFIYTLPSIYFFRTKGLIVLLLLVSIIFFIANITNETQGMISMLLISIFTLLISGGIIPLVFLPNIFNMLAKMTPNYWVININNGPIFIIMIIVYAIILNILSYYIMNRRLKG